MEMQPGLQAFMAESRELLDAMEDALLRLEKAPDDAEALNAVFRAAHTIKGSAGVFEFQDIVEFTHAWKRLVDVRASDVRVDATPDRAPVVLRRPLLGTDRRLSSSDPQHDEALREVRQHAHGAARGVSQPAARIREGRADVEPSSALAPAELDTWHFRCSSAGRAAPRDGPVVLHPLSRHSG
jgi:chemotaxis protein histidine kinase CheA